MAMFRRMSRSFSSLPSSSLDGYLQHTVIPTYHFQKSLMRLPIPKLEDTCSRYLAAVQPVVSADSYAATQEAVLDFQNGIGKDLHDSLIARDKAHLETSYINTWWHDMYVTDRRPLMINYNPQIRIRDDPDVFKNTQLQRSASLIASSMRFFKTLRDKQLAPDIFFVKPALKDAKWFNTMCAYLPERVAFYGAAAFDAYPLDMSQYPNLFQSTRIPGKEVDVLKTFPDSKHIVVQRGTQFYPIDVLKEDGSLHSDMHIMSSLNSILSRPLENTGHGLGVLTTVGRTEWANARDQLVKSDLNAASLEMIDSAIFMVCLEHTSPSDTTSLSKCFLHGEGNNRWLDKSFQLIVSANGKASVNFEHSWGDGVAVLRYLNETFDDSVSYPSLDESQMTSEAVKPLEWKRSAATKKNVKKAAKIFNDSISRLLVESSESSLTKSGMKKYKVGIDGLLQMTIQLAHYRLHGTFVSTYESASTAAFKHGRTETVRPCTMEAINFCKVMCNKSSTSSEKEKAFRTAALQHGVLTKAGVMGQGCDRHLFGLKKMSAINNTPLHPLFTLDSAEVMNKIILSTSTLSSPALEGGSFGPVNEDCYAVGYGMEEMSLFQLAAYRKDLPQFAELLTKSLQDTVDILSEPGRKN